MARRCGSQPHPAPCRAADARRHGRAGQSGHRRGRMPGRQRRLARRREPAQAGSPRVRDVRELRRDLARIGGFRRRGNLRADAQGRDRRLLPRVLLPPGERGGGARGRGVGRVQEGARAATGGSSSAPGARFRAAAAENRRDRAQRFPARPGGARAMRHRRDLRARAKAGAGRRLVSGGAGARADAFIADRDERCPTRCRIGGGGARGARPRSEPIAAHARRRRSARADTGGGLRGSMLRAGLQRRPGLLYTQYPRVCAPAGS